MIAVVKYGAGNVRSLLSALERLGYRGELTDDPDKICKADKVIFPGVGEASSAMRALKEKNLDEAIRSLTRPFLGICIGMQVMCSYLEEGSADGIGIFPDSVVRFPSSCGVKIPHMGWDTISYSGSPLLGRVRKDGYFYFVHSYYAPVSEYTIASCEYGGIEFSAALAKDCYYGTQFHPEKSGSEGEKVLLSFLEDL